MNYTYGIYLRSVILAGHLGVLGAGILGKLEFMGVCSGQRQWLAVSDLEILNSSRAT